MSSSREESPDWLRSFKAQNHSVVTLSSSSDSSPNNSPVREEDNQHEELAVNVLQDKDPNPDAVLIDDRGEPPVNKARSAKASKNKKKVENETLQKGDLYEGETAEAEILEKQAVDPQVSSRLPLVFSEKVQRSKALVECEGDSIDMSGDVGAVGRIAISDTPNGSHEMLLDLKGTIYKTTIVPSRTFCVVSFGQTEAKVEAIMNDFIQLKPHSNVYESETMIEGTLDGFSFDSEEEGDKMPKPSARQSNKKNENEDDPTDPTDAKSNGKAEKSLGVLKKKGKTTVKRPKMGGRKAQVSKKAKKSKK
ncbi:DNA-binding protein BIN4 isoform X4 [Cinnamomum micranthum f. kanehirae]|uniref:DNA-binding protein BIN4 isoform X4 n=1 Tax=Cinnamomum micranthum f. kanehirae TaxID=337451 RepID=A0A443NVY4_9MAGN|nr:DNA-binding protein BIN4 isoform X4 [Cinnamomum micranthum f. kanehirae]